MKMKPFPLLDAALNNATSPIVFFVRDDDVGWADVELFALCDRVGGRAPLDLAVIPTAITPEVAAALLDLDRPLRFHQHGFAHRNHQTSGKKCELSDERAAVDIQWELQAGRDRLLSMFKRRLDPIFTPPWNRCGAAAANALAAMGVQALSRDRGATPLNVPGLVEIGVAVDWVRRRADLDEALARAATESPVGIMLHHEVMDHSDLDRLDALLDVLVEHANAHFAPMVELVEAMA